MHLDDAAENFSYFIKVELGLSNNTAEAYLSDIAAFIRYAENIGCQNCNDITINMIEGYIAHRTLGASRHAPVAPTNDDKTDEKIGHRSAHRQLISLRRWLDFLVDEGEMDVNVAKLIELPKFAQKNPVYLTEAEVEALIKAPNVETPLGLRDRAMIETIYATGMRVSELINIKFVDIDFERACIIAHGKGSKDRLIPTGEVALKWIEHYVQFARKNLSKKHPKNKTDAKEPVFITSRGGAMTRQAFWKIIKKYALIAQIKRPSNSCSDTLTSPRHKSTRTSPANASNASSTSTILALVEMTSFSMP